MNLIQTIVPRNHLPQSVLSSHARVARHVCGGMNVVQGVAGCGNLRWVATAELFVGYVGVGVNGVQVGQPS